MLHVSAVLLAATVGALGCGGGSSTDGSEGASGSLTRAEFIKRADGICEQGEKKTQIEVQVNGQAYGLTEEQQPTQAQKEAIVSDLVLPSIQRQAEEISVLNPPAGDEAEVDRILAAIENGVSEGEADPAKTLGAESPFSEAKKLAGEYGFKVCGQN